MAAQAAHLSVKDIVEDRPLFYQCENIFRIAGFWRSENRSGWDLPFVWIRRFFFNIILGICFVVSMYSGVPIHFQEGDYLRAMECATFPTAVVTMQIKLIVLIFRENDIKEYSKDLRRLVLRHENTAHVKASLKAFRRILYTGLTAMASTIIGYTLYPLFLTGPRFLTTKTAFTFGNDVLKSPYYEIYMIYQTAGYLFNTCLAMYFDMMYCGILSVTAAVFRNINDEMRSLLHYKMGDRVLKTKKERAQRAKILKKIIIDYTETAKFIRATEETYMTVSLFHFSYNLIIIAFCLYQVSLLPIGSIRWYSMVFGVIAVGLQLTAYCHFGQALATETFDFWTNLYFTDWYNESPTFKEMILFSLHGTQNEIYLSAGKILTLSRDTLKNILRAIFTYYTFLMKFNRF